MMDFFEGGYFWQSFGRFKWRIDWSANLPDHLPMFDYQPDDKIEGLSESRHSL